MDVLFITNDNLNDQQRDIENAIANLLSDRCQIVSLTTQPYTTGVVSEIKWTGGITESRNHITFLSQLLYTCQKHK